MDTKGGRSAEVLCLDLFGCSGGTSASGSPCAQRRTSLSARADVPHGVHHVRGRSTPVGRWSDGERQGEGPVKLSVVCFAGLSVFVAFFSVLVMMQPVPRREDDQVGHRSGVSSAGAGIPGRAGDRQEDALAAGAVRGPACTGRGAGLVGSYGPSRERRPPLFFGVIHFLLLFCPTP